MSTFLRYQRPLPVFGVLLLMASGTSQAQSSNRFFTPVEASEPRTAITDAGAWSIGFVVDGLVPFSSPYSAVNGSVSTPFRFQASTSTAFDLSLGFSKGFEMGLQIGSNSFASRFQSSSGNQIRIETAKFRALPNIKALARLYFNVAQGIATQLEGALGYGFGKINISTTDGGIADQSESFAALSAHLGYGLALGWAENYTAHFIAGYGLQTIGAKTYSSTVYDIKQASMVSGIFAKAQVRYQF